MISLRYEAKHIPIDLYECNVICILLMLHVIGYVVHSQFHAGVPRESEIIQLCSHKSLDAASH